MPSDRSDETVQRLREQVESGGVSCCTKCGWVGTPERLLGGFDCGRPGCGYMVSAPTMSLAMPDARRLRAELDRLSAIEEAADTVDGCWTRGGIKAVTEEGRRALVGLSRAALTRPEKEVERDGE